VDSGFYPQGKSVKDVKIVMEDRDRGGDGMKTYVCSECGEIFQIEDGGDCDEWPSCFGIAVVREVAG
jgi:hypothetical protein